MATQHDTGGGEAVPLELPGSQVKILRGTIGICLGSVRSDLKTPELMPKPERARREAEAYERLLGALDRRSITLPDAEARKAVEALIFGVEQDTDYLRLVAEHDALSCLLVLLKAEAHQ